MGMFDSFYDADGGEWQTKAFGCALDVWRVGEPFETEGPQTFQVEVIGGRFQLAEESRWAFVTVRDGLVEAAGVERDESLPLFNYHHSNGVAWPATSPAQVDQP